MQKRNSNIIEKLVRLNLSVHKTSQTSLTGWFPNLCKFMHVHTQSSTWA